MIKTFLLAGFSTFLLACSSNSKKDSAIEATSQTHNQNQMNPVTATMDKMMHDMHNAKPTGNNDVDFATMMLEHHKGAVEMSKVEVDKGKNAELIAFAQKVIDDQNKEIEFMQDGISKATVTNSLNAADFQKALTGSMMAMMNNKTIIHNDIDKDFATQMIPHHQSAVDMAEAYLKYGQEASLKTLCENIINSQKKEITWLNEWLAKNK